MIDHLMYQYTARKLWRDYFASGVDGVVFIVDAVDRERFPEAKRELDVSFTFKSDFEKRTDVYRYLYMYIFLDI